MSLIVWRVRPEERKSERKNSRQQRKPRLSLQVQAGGLSDTDFAALSGGYNPNAGYDPSAPSSGDFDLCNDDKITECMMTGKLVRES